MSDLIYEAIKTLGEMNAQRHDEIIGRLDKINGRVGAHDVRIADLHARFETCRDNCQDCLQRIEPKVEQLDTDVQAAKKVGVILASIVSALVTIGVALVGLL